MTTIPIKKDSKTKIEFINTRIDPLQQESILDKDFETFKEPAVLEYSGLDSLYFGDNKLEQEVEFRNIGTGPCQINFNSPWAGISVIPEQINLVPQVSSVLKIQLRNNEVYRNLLRNGRNISIFAEFFNVFNKVEIPRINIPNLEIPLKLERLVSSIELTFKSFGLPISNTPILNRPVPENEWSILLSKDVNIENVIKLLPYEYTQDGIGYLVSEFFVHTNPNDNEPFEMVDIWMTVLNDNNSVRVWNRSSDTLFNLNNITKVISPNGFERNEDISGINNEVNRITFNPNGNRASGPPSFTPLIITTKYQTGERRDFQIQFDVEYANDETRNFSKVVSFSFEDVLRPGV